MSEHDADEFLRKMRWEELGLSEDDDSAIELDLELQLNDLEDDLDEDALERNTPFAEVAAAKSEQLEAEAAQVIRTKQFADASARPAVKAESQVLRDDSGLMIAIVGDGWYKSFERDSTGNIVKVIEEREI